MGMFDTLIANNGEDSQIKCFNLPIYTIPYDWERKKFGVNTGVWFSGGLCRVIHEGDEVPYKTDWYDYTPDFVVVTDDSEYQVASFKNGKYDGFYNYTTLDDITDKQIKNVFNYYGQKVKVENLAQLTDFLIEMSTEWDKEHGKRNFGKLMDKWYENITDEHLLGALKDCLIHWEQREPNDFIDTEERISNNIKSIKQEINNLTIKD